MLTERQALQERLEKIDKDETAMIKEYQKQRNKIFERLRELDREEYKNLPDLKKLASLENHQESKPEKDIRKHVAVNILKVYSDGMSADELRSKIEKETNMQIVNMTSFMSSIMKKNPFVQKPRRGYYRFIKM
ncbi:hypothetical protein [Bacillus atrophaeus]|uniref:Rok-like winged helix domain-containing protein n=1 Tax=Bacillus atrophaeus TaxID=1452 RepID=UPI00077A51F1|nr:hypothetical protein [Bacillus atrophaeus]KXZ13244.1 hypothetical protein AXI57_15940 [Bacillus atrophaeus]MED4806350.1 hypothetical protein [Bacillus atrophaeus]UFD97624.1 ComK repressor Rok [Bacillus atrophaeus]GED04226.1 repressor Rok [Bacillus atrophaeus]